MRPRRDRLGDTILRLIVGLLAAVLLVAVIACENSEDDEPVQARVPAPASFDLLEAGFHQSSVEVALGERAEVSVEVRQEKHDRHICGVPSVFDPFGNVLQTLTPRQNVAEGTATHYVYESRYAFFAATDGEYGAKLENRGCLLDDVGAVATVQWAVYPVQD